MRSERYTTQSSLVAAEEANDLAETRDSFCAAAARRLLDIDRLDWKIEAFLDVARVSRPLSANDALPATFAGFVLLLESPATGSALSTLSATIENEQQTSQLRKAWAWVGNPEMWAPSLPAVVLAHLHCWSTAQEFSNTLTYSLRADFCRTRGKSGNTSLVASISPFLADPDASVRYHAHWGVCLLDQARLALPGLREFAEAGGIHYQEAAELAARRMPHADALAWHAELAKSPRKIRTGVRVAQGLADPALIPWLIELMRDPTHSRVAGEAFAMITGVDIAYLDLDLKEPPVLISDEPPEDATEPPNEDEDLPWPDAARIEAWWSKYRGQFTPGVRYILGRPLDYESATHALKFGYQRQRAAAALERVFLHPGEPLFDVAAPGFRQMRQLGLTRKDFHRLSPRW